MLIMPTARGDERRATEGLSSMIGYYIELAAHSLRRNKVLTALMILAIAVGIGASMTTLTIMHLLSGDPLRGRGGQIFYPQLDANPDSKGRQPYDMLDYSPRWIFGTHIAPTARRSSSTATSSCRHPGRGFRH
jgi:hypothetical protein